MNFEEWRHNTRAWLFHFIGNETRAYDEYVIAYRHNPTAEAARSLGTFMILDHMERARKRGLPYLYLGYWIEGSRKMDYKARFMPQERLGQNGVGIGESQKSDFSLGPDSQPDSLGQGGDSQASVAASATPLLYVKVPIGAIPSIDFGADVFGAGPASAAAFGGVVGSTGGKRKHTKRKRSLKRSNRKRRVTRRRYNKKKR